MFLAKMSKEIKMENRRRTKELLNSPMLLFSSKWTIIDACIIMIRFRSQLCFFLWFLLLLFLRLWLFRSWCLLLWCSNFFFFYLRFWFCNCFFNWCIFSLLGLGFCSFFGLLFRWWRWSRSFTNDLVRNRSGTDNDKLVVLIFGINI